MMRRATGLALAGLFALGAGMAQAGAVRETVLPNGLKVIVKEDRRAPVAVSQLWYRAGSMDEEEGTTGVAHVLEHMMFKGTRTVPEGGFSRRVAAVGGRENAFTSRDFTTYFEQVEKSKLPLMFQLEADRMRNLRLTDAAFAKEIKVVMEERRWRTEDKPESLVSEQVQAVAYQAHPYRRPVIGWMNDLEHMTAADARAWYGRWYTPNNATLVVVGDVRADEVFALARRHFGPLPARTLPSRKVFAEPRQMGTKRVTVKAPAKLPYLLMAYHAPVLRDAAKDWEPYALDMLAGVLDGNPAARLNRVLVREKQVALSVGTGYDSVSRGPALFMLDGTPAEGRTVADVEAALREEIARIQRDGVSPEELARVRSQVVASRVFQRDSMFAQAMEIGTLESTGFSHRDAEVMLRRLQEVTPEQVQAVARKYLVDDALTVGVLDPLPLENRKPAQPPKEHHHGL